MYGEDSQQSEPDEDLAPQLLGTNTEQLSPAEPATTNPTTAPLQSLLQIYRLPAILPNHCRKTKEIMDKLNKNTRAIRCMEKAGSNQNQIMKALNDSIRDLNQTIINSACEERRREEVKEDTSPCKDISLKKRRKTDHHSGHKETRR